MDSSSAGPLCSMRLGGVPTSLAVRTFPCEGGGTGVEEAASVIDKFVILLGGLLFFGVIGLFIFVANREPFKPGEFRSFLWKAFLAHILFPAALGALIWQSTCNWIDAKQSEFEQRRRTEAREEFKRRMQERLEQNSDDPEYRAYHERVTKRWNELREAADAAAEENDR